MSTTPRQVRKRSRRLRWRHEDGIFRPYRPGGEPSPFHQPDGGLSSTSPGPSPSRPSEAQIEEFQTYLVDVRGLAATTSEQYARHLRYFVNFLTERDLCLDAATVTTALVAEYFAVRAADTWGPGIRCLARYALGSYFDYNPNFAGVDNPSRATPPPRKPPAQTDAYSDTQAQQILALAAERTDPRGNFDHTVLACLRYTGLRVSELCDLTNDRVDLDQRRIRVLGKGAKQRLVPIAEPLVRILTVYTSETRPLTPASNYLLASPHPRRGHIDPRAVRYITETYGAATNIPGPHNPHRWRHTCATSLLRAGVDLHRVQRILGHANITTTIRYLHLVDDDLRDAIDHAFDT